MIHRAYRSLNDPVRLLGFTAPQWLTLIVTGALAVGATRLVGLATRPTITICALVLSSVAAVAFAAEPGGARPLGLLYDLLRMLRRPHSYAPGMPPSARPTLGLLVDGEPAGNVRVSADHNDRADEVFAT